MLANPFRPAGRFMRNGKLKITHKMILTGEKGGVIGIVPEVARGTRSKDGRQGRGIARKVRRTV
ncbi:hypothetical protein, partial [Brevibacillus laterosporus]|uniref:hypothetical protein n=1 Tax=Brevibacillus laterosporus TaxID=1465 RepID=UPI00215C0DFB